MQKSEYHLVHWLHPWAMPSPSSASCVMLAPAHDISRVLKLRMSSYHHALCLPDTPFLVSAALDLQGQHQEQHMLFNCNTNMPLW